MKRQHLEKMHFCQISFMSRKEVEVNNNADVGFKLFRHLCMISSTALPTGRQSCELYAVWSREKGGAAFVMCWGQWGSEDECIQIIQQTLIFVLLMPQILQPHPLFLVKQLRIPLNYPNRLNKRVCLKIIIKLLRPVQIGEPSTVWVWLWNINRAA